MISASLLIPRTGRHVRGRLDGLGILLVGSTLLPAMYGIAYLGSGSASAAAPAFVVPEVVAAVSLVLFVRHARRATAPFIPARLLVGRGFGVMNLLNFLYGGGRARLQRAGPAVRRAAVRDRQPGGRHAAHRPRGRHDQHGRARGAAAAPHRQPLADGDRLRDRHGVGMLGLASGPAGGVSPYLWLAAAAAVSGIGMGTATPASNNATMSAGAGPGRGDRRPARHVPADRWDHRDLGHLGVPGPRRRSRASPRPGCSSRSRASSRWRCR